MHVLAMALYAWMSLLLFESTTVLSAAPGSSVSNVEIASRPLLVPRKMALPHDCDPGAWVGRFCEARPLEAPQGWVDLCWRFPLWSTYGRWPIEPPVTWEVALRNGLDLEGRIKPGLFKHEAINKARIPHYHGFSYMAVNDCPAGHFCRQMQDQDDDAHIVCQRKWPSPWIDGWLPRSMRRYRVPKSGLEAFEDYSKLLFRTDLPAGWRFAHQDREELDRQHQLVAWLKQAAQDAPEHYAEPYAEILRHQRRERWRGKDVVFDVEEYRRHRKSSTPEHGPLPEVIDGSISEPELRRRRKQSQPQPVRPPRWWRHREQTHVQVNVRIQTGGDAADIVSDVAVAVDGDVVRVDHDVTVRRSWPDWSTYDDEASTSGYGGQDQDSEQDDDHDDDDLSSIGTDLSSFRDHSTPR